MKRNIQKFILLIQSCIFTILFLFKSLFSNNNIHNGRKDVVISLTTYGWRYNFVFLTIESILSQNVKPSKIFLWIYKNDKPWNLTKWFLDRQCKRGLEIKYIDENTRSYKKLSYVFTKTKCDFDIIVTADDDVFYPKDWLRNFIEHPKLNTHVLCNRGRVITFKNNSKELLPYRCWPLANISNNFDNLIIPTGVSGISYPLKSLDARISDFESIKKVCPFADDIWYKMITTSNGFQSIILNNNVPHFPPVLSSLTKGLEKMNVDNDLNSSQFNDAMTYFNLERTSFEHGRL